MTIEDVIVPLENGKNQNLPKEEPKKVSKKNKLETNYDEYGVDIEKVNRYGSVYILVKDCTINKKTLQIEGDGTIEMIYWPALAFAISQEYLKYIPSKTEIEVSEWDRLVPLSTFKNYPNSDRYQIDRDSFVIYIVEK